MPVVYWVNMNASPKTLRFIIIILSVLIIGVSFCLLTINDQRPAAKTGHYATLMGREFYDRAYASGSTLIKAPDKTAGGIVNHHLLAAPLLAQFFDGLKDQKIKHLIIIGPDHMSRGKNSVTISTQGWKTGYGDVRPDAALINRLSSEGAVNIEDAPFDYEFSVGGLVTFAKRSLPKALVTTIIVRSDAKNDDLIKLAAALPRSSDTLVVASIDFSHYLPSDVADFHDLTARAIISNFDIDNFDKLEIDSVPTLRVAMEYFKLRGAMTDTLVASSNSAKLTGQLDLQETTSYLNQYFSRSTYSRTRISGPVVFDVKTSLYLGNLGKNAKIVSPEDRFMRGFMSIDYGSTLPTQFKKPNLAVGIARYADKTVYYLFPTIVEKGTRRLMTAGEKTVYFRQNNIKESIVTYNN